MILVDAVTEHETPLRHKRWSHMVSTVGLDELNAMAIAIGLRLAWLQTGSFNHYDITPPKRALAIRLGAREVDSRLLLFGNYYANRRPGVVVPAQYREQLTALGVPAP